MATFDFIAATAKFYEVIFEELPAFRERFSNVESQTRMFQVALKFVLSENHESEKLQNFLKDLGGRHRKLGLQRMHMRIGRKAFKSALIAGDPKIDKATIAKHMNVFAMLEEAMGFVGLSDNFETD